MVSSDGRRWRVSGAVRIDGVAMHADVLARVTALVPQDDLLLRSLTVEECLRYSAALRLEPELSPQAVQVRVTDQAPNSQGPNPLSRSSLHPPCHACPKQLYTALAVGDGTVGC